MKIVISGNHLDPTDFDYIENAESLDIKVFPKLSEISQDEILELHAECQSADLLIVALYGSPLPLIDCLALDKIKIPKALWSFDSHHSWATEIQYQNQFDKIFIVHSPYQKYFTQDKIEWLPAAFVRFGIDKLIEIHRQVNANQKKEFDLVFPYNSYHLGKRDEISLAIRHILEKTDLRFFFGSVESGMPYVDTLLKSGIVLNVSLLDDLNIRNFEALAFNKVLLTNKTPDHVLLAPRSESTVFFERNLSDFKAKLLESLTLLSQPVNTASWIINNHMVIHRIVKMINICLHTDYKIKAIDADLSYIPHEREFSHIPHIKKSLYRTDDDLSIERKSNIGVLVLSQRQISPQPYFCNTRLQIEDNIGESIHLHWRNLRFDFTVRDFLSVAQGVETSIDAWTERNMTIHQIHSTELTLDPKYVDNLGGLKEKIISASVDYVYINDLKCIEYAEGKGGDVRPYWVSIADSLASGFLGGRIEEYASYHQFIHDTEHNRNNFEELVQSIKKFGYPYNNQFIILHGNEPFIRDGQHRASIIFNELGNVKIPIVRLKFSEECTGWEMGNLSPKKYKENTVTQVHSGQHLETTFLANDMKRVLFVRTDSIGDTILAMPMLPHLRRQYPDAQFGVLCQEHISELYLASPHVDFVICFDRNKAWADETYRATIIKEIGDLKPTLILNSLYSREPLTELLILTNRQGKIVGLEGDLSNISEENRNHCNSFYTQLLSSQGTHRLELCRHRDFLNGLGISVGNLEPHVWTLPEDEAQAEAFFQEQNWDPVNTIALFPFSQQECKSYPYFPEALRSFVDYNILILGGPEVVDLGAKMANEIPSAINLVGKTTLTKMAALLRKCRLYVGADSAGAHMACAVGLPNVVVMGGGHFGRFFPYSPLTSMVCLPLECFGCNWNCSYERVHCVKDIDSAVITEAMVQTLKNHSAKPRVFVQQKNRKGEIPQWADPSPFMASSQVEIIRVESIDEVDRREGLLNQNKHRNLPILKKQINQNGDSRQIEDLKVPSRLAYEPTSDFSPYATNQVSGLAETLMADISSRFVKQRVLAILTKLEKDYWLEKHIERLRMGIETGDSSWDTATFLNWYAFTFQPTTYLEVGVRRGGSMAMVLKESPNAKAYGFDLWIPEYSTIPEKGIYTTNLGPEFVQSEFSKLGISPAFELIVGKSQETLPRFFDNPANNQIFDLILIDGDHTVDGAKKDLEIAFAHLAPGGALVFDDITHPAHLDLKDLWDLFKARYQEFLFIEDTTGKGTGVAFRPSFEKLVSLYPQHTNPLEGFLSVR